MFVGNSAISVEKYIIEIVKNKLIDLIENHKVEEFYCGGYRNFDCEMALLVER